VVDEVRAARREAERDERQQRLSEWRCLEQHARRAWRAEDEDVLRPLLRPRGAHQPGEQGLRRWYRFVAGANTRLVTDHGNRLGGRRASAVVDAQRAALTLRHTGRGRCRNAVISNRSGEGTHTISRPDASARAIASATVSGVVDNGAASIPVVIFECT